jgi:hypothetical protein
LEAPILSKEERETINGQVAHLSMRRNEKVAFQTERITYAICHGFIRFVASLDSSRRDWFAAAEDLARDFIAEREQQAEPGLTATSATEIFLVMQHFNEAFQDRS